MTTTNRRAHHILYRPHAENQARPRFFSKPNRITILEKWGIEDQFEITNQPQDLKRCLILLQWSLTSDSNFCLQLPVIRTTKWIIVMLNPKNANNIAYTDVMLTLLWLWLVESILNHLVTRCQRLEMPPILNNEFKPLMNWVGTASQMIIHEDSQKLLSNHFLQMSLGAGQKLPTDWSICPGCLPLIGLFVHM